MSALLGWSLRYVEEFAPDILAARREAVKLQERRMAFAAQDSVFSDREQRARRLQRLVAYLDKLRAEGRGVPIWCGGWYGDRVLSQAIWTIDVPVNVPLLDIIVGMPPGKRNLEGLHTRPSVRRVIETAVRELGTEPGGLNVALAGVTPSGDSWVPGFDLTSLRIEEQMLQVACYIVCAFLTGMRDSEIQQMELGALEPVRSPEGAISRYNLRSRVFKGFNSMGVEATWVTIEPVAMAVLVAEQLVQLSGAKSKKLWQPIAHAGVTREVVGGTQIGNLLRKFTAHLNARFGTAADPVLPLNQDGTEWRLSTRQFRRTAAWFIANRPFGLVAGKIQFKHASIIAFQGYAGQSASGFPAEIARERALGQMDDVLEYYDAWEAGQRLQAGGARKLESLFDEIKASIGALPGAFTDRPRLRAMLASVGRTLHVGLLADCFFDPAAAVCLSQAPGTDRKAPLLGLCRPTRCANACVAPKHLDAWAAARAHISNLLKEKRLSEVQREALKRDAAEIDALLGAPPVR